jgi:hypothetical protein
MRSLILRDGLGWGFLLWLAGYFLGFCFYPFVPPAMIGWYVTPFGIALTCLVLWKWVRVSAIGEAILLGLIWSAIAIICDYFFLVKLLNPPDGYYKFDVYLYYLLMLALPIAAAMLRRSRQTT